MIMHTKRIEPTISLKTYFVQTHSFPNILQFSDFWRIYNFIPNQGIIWKKNLLKFLENGSIIFVRETFF